MEIHASSAANIEVSLDVTDLDVHASSAGDIVLEGKSKSINVQVSSAGESMPITSWLKMRKQVPAVRVV